VVVAVSCYVSFSDIDSGSITAVLATNKSIPGVSKSIVTLMNVLVILAVVFSFPLQLFPAIQLIESAAGVGQQPQKARNNSSKKIKHKGEAKQLLAVAAAAGAAAAGAAAAEEEEEAGSKSMEEGQQHETHKTSVKEGQGPTSPSSPATPLGANVVSPSAQHPNQRSDNDDDDVSDGDKDDDDDDDNDDDADGNNEGNELLSFDYRMVDAYDLEGDGSGCGGVPLPKEHHEGNLHPSSLPLSQLLFRTLVVCGVGAVTEAIPDLGLIIDILGALFGSFLVIILPSYLSIVSTKLLSPEEQVCWW
jgi:hypothetical protein